MNLPLITELSRSSFWQDPDSTYLDWHSRSASGLMKTDDGMIAIVGYDALDEARTHALMQGLDLVTIAEAQGEAIAKAAKPLIDQWRCTTLSLSGTLHEDQRKAVRKSLDSSVVGQAVLSAENAIQDFTAQLEAGKTCDLLEDYAAKIACTVWCDLLSIDREMGPQIKLWCEQLTPILELETDPIKCQVAVNAAKDYWSYLGRHQLSLREQGVSSFFDRLETLLEPIYQRHSGDANAPLSAAQLVGTLLYDGIDTFKAMLGNTLYELLRHPDQYAALLADPGLAGSVWNEGLRHGAAAWATYRVPVEDVVIGGIDISAGTPVMMIWAAANRDPTKFADPNTFDIGRRNARPLTFGGGQRTCLGSSMATSLGELAIRRLAESGAQMTLTAAPRRWSEFTTVRWIDAVPVVVLS